MILEAVNRLVWGVPTLLLILGAGIYFTIQTRFAQFRFFPRALKLFFAKLGNKEKSNGVSSFQALCTALAATVGTGNLVGVAGAIAIGGPGAVFWMWICALLGMVTKFAEATLAVRYRTREHGEYLGGPMYMIENGLGRRWHWLACLYSFFGIFAAFGVGNATQINAVIDSLNTIKISWGGCETTQGNLLMGLVMAVLVGITLLGGAGRIGKVASVLIPFVAGGYVLLGIGVLFARVSEIPAAFLSIIQGAFNPQAATGGLLGSAFVALRVGVSRGVFTNEAGMGTAAIAHGSAEVSHPVEQGMMGIVEVFLDTIVICTITALVILVSGVSIPYGTDPGGTLTGRAFSEVYGNWVNIFLAVALASFAFATVLGWGLYGARCVQFLLGYQYVKMFSVLQIVTVIAGAVLQTSTVWLLAETVNGLMAIPNLIALVMLSPELIRLTKEYKM